MVIYAEICGFMSTNLVTNGPCFDKMAKMAKMSVIIDFSLK